MHGLEAEYWGKVDFVYLDRESAANRDVVEQYGIFGQPIFILIGSDGTELQRWFGRIDLEAIRQALDAAQTS